MAPAAEVLVQVKSAIPLSMATVSRLQVCQPITCDIDESCNTSAQNASSDKNDPSLTRICKLLDMSQDAAGAGVQVSQTLSLLGVLEDPVNRCEVVIAHPSARAFDIPIQPIRILGVLEVVTGVTGGIEVVQDQLRGAIRVGAATKVLQSVIWGAWKWRAPVTGRVQGRREESWKAKRRC